MAHGGRIALLGIQTGEVPIDFTPIVFNMLTLKGIYGREMYETWYQMSVMVQSGLDITPGDHPPVLLPGLRGRVRGRVVGRLRQGDTRLDRSLGAGGSRVRIAAGGADR